jgi:hypothetical protein
MTLPKPAARGLHVIPVTVGAGSPVCTERGSGAGWQPPSYTWSAVLVHVSLTSHADSLSSAQAAALASTSHLHAQARVSFACVFELKAWDVA